jgi:hypothetical protein
VIRTERPLVGRLFLMLGGAGACLLAWHVTRNWEYFSLPAVRRPGHHAHPLLRSSGDLGLWCGVVASGLFLLNLTYLLRKRVAAIRWLGSLRSWMALHLLTGLAGCAFVLLHSAFLPRSSLGILALSSLGVVVATGLVGRYIYASVPRSLRGRELEMEELRKRLEDHRAQLEACGLSLVGATPEPVRSARSVPARFVVLLAGSRAIRREYRRLREAVLAHAELRPLAGQILPLAKKYSADRQWLTRYTELRGLMGSWRFLHRWLAILMLAVVLFHVLVALRFGDLVLPGGLLP